MVDHKYQNHFPVQRGVETTKERVNYGYQAGDEKLPPTSHHDS